jgi:nitrile hydratase alpha subunit
MADPKSEGLGGAYRKVIAQAWSDPAYKQKLLSDPSATLTAAGFKVSGRKVKVFEDTNDVVHLVLPPPPASGELTDDVLDRIAGGDYLTAISDCCPTPPRGCDPSKPTPPTKLPPR